jgi:hypothetical protein
MRPAWVFVVVRESKQLKKAKKSREKRQQLQQICLPLRYKIYETYICGLRDKFDGTPYTHIFIICVKKVQSFGVAHILKFEFCRQNWQPQIFRQKV